MRLARRMLFAALLLAPAFALDQRPPADLKKAQAAKPAPQPQNPGAEARIDRRESRMTRRDKEMDRRMKARKR